MAIFGKKNHQEPTQEPKPAAEAQKEQPKDKHSGGKKKKRTSGLAKVLRESVVETVLDQFRENTPFIRVEHGEEKYVGLVLNTADIGGLDRRSKSDEAKGSIIECINAGRIKTYVTPDLMDAERICFIPDPMTLKNMDEFSLLTDTSYEFCQVDQSGDIELLGVKTTLSKIMDLVVADGHIDDLLGDPEEDEPEGDDDSGFFGANADPAAEIGTSGESVETVPPADEFDDDIDFHEDEDGDGAAADGDGSGYDPSLDMNWSDDMPASDNAAAVSGDDPYAAAMDPANAPEQTIPAGYTDEVIVRKFYSSDLDLEVTAEPFDAQFMQGSKPFQFDTSRGPGWLNDYLNEKSRAANTDLATMHTEMLSRLRRIYFRAVSLACDRIRGDLDIYNPDTQYGEMYQGLQNDKDSALYHIDQRVARRKEEINKAWENKLRDVGLSAARQAQQQFKDRFGEQHEIAVYNVEASERAAIDDDFQDNVRELNDRRRVEAANLLDLSLSEILEELSDLYEAGMKDEKDLYDQLASNMQKYIEEHMTDDIARSKALAEELSQRNKADEVLHEQTIKMNNLVAEHQAARDKLNAEIDRMRIENKSRIAELQAASEGEKKKAADERDVMQAKYDELLERYQRLDETKEAEFENRLKELKAANEGWQSRCDMLVENNRRTGKFGIFVVVAAVLAALALGVIGGLLWSAKSSGNILPSNDPQAAVQTGYVQSAEYPYSDMIG